MSADAPGSAGGIYTRGGKRVLDLLLAGLMLPLIAPLIGFVWLMARLDGGPGFFGHVRVGKGGRSFRCWKIRTMVPDAETRLKAHLSQNPEAAEEWARNRKLKHDPRVTAFGDFLRRSSLDELPQIWNVICGNMSFVGPRPVVRDELAKYGSSARFYLAQKPGITGLWQVSGRNDISYSQRVALDVSYFSRRSLLFDLRLIAQTGVSVLSQTGK